LQKQLKEQGLYKGKIDGIYGPLTKKAVEAENRIPASSTYSPTVTNGSINRASMGDTGGSEYANMYMEKNGILPKQAAQGKKEKTLAKSLFNSITPKDVAEYDVNFGTLKRIAEGHNRFNSKEFESGLDKNLNASPKVKELNDKYTNEIYEAFQAFKKDQGDIGLRAVGIPKVSRVEDLNSFQKLDLLDAYSESLKSSGGRTLIPTGDASHLTDVLGNPELRKASADHASYYNNNGTGLNTTLYGKREPSEEDALNLFLGLPGENKKFGVSDYKPSVSKEQIDFYYNIKDPNFQKSILAAGKDLPLGKNAIIGSADYVTGDSIPNARFAEASIKNSTAGDDPAMALGNFTVSRGKDAKGDYVSYYDKYDLNPKGLVNDVNIMGKPFEIYDRIYLDNEQMKTKKYKTGGSLNPVSLPSWNTEDYKGQKMIFDSTTGKPRQAYPNMYRKQAAGGELPYSPVGLPVTPEAIAAQKKASETSFGQQLGKFASNPVVQGIAGMIPGIGALGSMAINASGRAMAPKQALPGQDISEAFQQVGTKNYDNYAASGGALSHMSGTKMVGDTDTRLSNNAVQVNGNAHMTDGNQYQMGDTKVHLDDGEVVRGNMVLSNKLTNPLTGKTFAQDASKSEKLIEKLSKRGTPVDKATITRLNKDLDTITQIQEEMATQMGLRQPQNNEVAMAAGGPIPNGEELKKFQTWASNNGFAITPDGKWGSKTEAAYKAIGNTYNLSLPARNINKDNANLTTWNNSAGQKISGYTQSSRALASRVTPTIPSLTSLNQRLPVSERDPLTGQIIDPASVTGAFELQNNRRRNLNANGVPNIKGITIPVVPNASKDVNTTDRGLGVSAGTALQGISAASQMIRSMGKSPANKDYQITTPISKNYYAADQALQQNQSNYAQARNSIDAGSVNTRRAINNSLYASKLSADNQVISQTSDMNRTANIDYENRLAQRQGQNVQLAQYKNELDARDLGAQNNAKDTAFNTLSNFGRAMDERKSAIDQLELLKALYPNVYGNTVKKKTGGKVY
jgi:hypothetical protein